MNVRVVKRDLYSMDMVVESTVLMLVTLGFVMAKDSKEYRRNTEQYLISFQHAKNMFNQGIISYEELTKIEEKLRKKILYQN